MKGVGESLSFIGVVSAMNRGGVSASILLLNGLLKEVSISSGSPVSGMVNADDVEIFARSQSGLASGHMPWVRFARGIHREVSERDNEWSGQDMDELPQRALYREWLRRMK